MSDTTDQIIEDFSDLIFEHYEGIRNALGGTPRGRTARSITRFAQIIHAAELAIDTLADPAPTGDEATDSDAIPGLPSDNPRSADDIEAMSGDFKYNHARARFNADRLTWDRIPQQDTRDDGNGAQVTA